MKKQAIIASILALTAIPAYAAIDCATPPTCESLGYTDTSTACAGKFLPCPMDSSKGFCAGVASCSDLGYKYSAGYCNTNYLVCPFNSNNRKCLETNKSGCDLDVNKYYNYSIAYSMDECASTRNTSAGVYSGLYIGNNKVIFYSKLYAGGSLGSTSTLNANCQSESYFNGANLAISSELLLANGSTGFDSNDYVTRDGKCMKWTGSAFVTISCPSSGLYGLCVKEIK